MFSRHSFFRSKFHHFLVKVLSISPLSEFDLKWENGLLNIKRSLLKVLFR